MHFFKRATRFILKPNLSPYIEFSLQRMLSSRFFNLHKHIFTNIQMYNRAAARVRDYLQTVNSVFGSFLVHIINEKGVRYFNDNSL